jgi:hypothetical protein
LFIKKLNLKLDDHNQKNTYDLQMGTTVSLWSLKRDKKII